MFAAISRSRVSEVCGVVSGPVCRSSNILVAGERVLQTCWRFRRAMAPHTGALAGGAALVALVAALEVAVLAPEGSSTTC